MATYRYEITMMTQPGIEEFLRGIMPSHPLITRWKIHNTWRTVLLAPSVSMMTLSDTGPGVNKADLDNEHIAVANEIKAQYPSYRVIVTATQTEKVIELT